MCSYVAKSDVSEFIIATEIGLLHTLKKNNPTKQFFALSDVVICPNMKRGTLLSVKYALMGVGGETVKVDKNIAASALKSLEKMLELSA
jgi:quinolinate synthase